MEFTGYNFFFASPTLSKPLNSICMIQSTTAQTKGGHVDIGRKLKDIREQKNLSQGDIEKRTGLLRCYVSRVENGHTVPSVETIEKFSRALDIPAYQLFMGAEQAPGFGKIGRKFSGSRKDERQLSRFTSLLAKMKTRDRKLLLTLGSKMVGRKKKL